MPQVDGMTLYRWFGLVFVFGVSVVLAVYLIDREFSHRLRAEDGIIENLSAGFYLLAFLLCVWFLMKAVVSRWPAVALAALSVFGFLEEISYGERLFDLEMPQVDGMKIDTGHDLITLALKWLAEWALEHPGLAIFAMVLAGLSGGVLAWRYRATIRAIIVFVVDHPPALFLTLFGGFIACSMLIDLHLVFFNILFLMEELFEMYAALALVFCSLALRSPVRSTA